MCGIAYTLLARTLIGSEGPDSVLARAMGDDTKGRISLLLYALAMPLAFMNRWVALALYFVVAAMWLLPDRRIEREVAAPR